MIKLVNFLKSILLSPMWLFMGAGGGGEPDINKTTAAQQAQWAQYAKDWNTYIKDIEPRVESAFKQAVEDPTSRITNEMRTGVLGSYNPTQAVQNKVPMSTGILRGQSALGGMLGSADIKGAEAAKDYTANTLNNILAAKMGAKAGTQQALGTLASGESSNFMKNLENQQAIDAARGATTSSAIGALGSGLYGGFTKTNVGTAPTTPGTGGKA